MPASTIKNITNNNLLDTGKDMQKLDKNEKIFYKDQLLKRKFWISEEIDEEHEIEVCKWLELSREIDENEQEEESFIFDISFGEVINTSIKDKKTSEEVQNAIATVCYRSGISVPKAWVGLQAACKILCGHKYLLTHPL